MSSPGLRDRVELFPIWIVSILFAVLAIRLFDLQVIRAQTYRRLSEENRIRVIPVYAPRGHILDRHGEVLVCNRPCYVISIVPFQLREIERTVQALAGFLDMDPEEILDRIRESKGRRFEPIKIKRDVDFQTLSVIQEHKLDLPGVIYQVEPRREYLWGRLAAHLLGTVGEISAGELDNLRGQGYRHGSLIGKGGVEREYESFLRGVDGIQYVEVSAVGREIGPLPERPPSKPRPGYDLVLTIDVDLQRSIEESFPDTLVGAVVALDPSTGDILAMVSQPSFDPNLFASTIPESTWRSLNEDPDHPLINRTIQSAYPPGSIMKAVTAAAGLEHGVVNPQTRFAPCSGAYKFGNRWWRCWRPEGHGSLAFLEAMSQSCDVYFYQLGLRLGLQRWSAFALRCGLGKPMGIDMAGEVSGLVPTKEYFDQRYGKGQWSSGVLLNLSIGQGENLITPLQAAALMGAIGNDGVLCRPHLIQEIRSPVGKVIHQAQEVTNRLPISASNLKILQAALQSVVGHPWGTGRQAAVDGVEVAGKTGTAENPRGEDHAWFAGFAPAEHPRIAVAVLVEHGGHGGSVAAPIAGKIIQAYLVERGS